MERSSYKKQIVSVILIALGILLIIYSSDIKNGVLLGIGTAFNSIIPSLYLLTLLSIFIIKCDAFDNPIISIFTKLLFGINGAAGSVYLLSLFCGYPVGARLIEELYKKGEITKEAAGRMLVFCINPAPAFCIGVIGLGCYSSLEAGLIIYASSIIPSILGARIYKPKLPEINAKSNLSEGYFQAFIQAINDSNKAMLNICSWVILSSAIINVLPSKLRLLAGLIEVTYGAIEVSSKMPICFVAAIVGFGGLSVIFQVSSAAKSIKPPIFKLIILRAVSGAASGMLAYILIKLFPPQILASSIKFALGENPSNPLSSISLICFTSTSFIFLRKKLKH